MHGLEFDTDLIGMHTPTEATFSYLICLCSLIKEMTNATSTILLPL